MPYELGGVCRRKSRSFTRCGQTVNETAGAGRIILKFHPVSGTRTKPKRIQGMPSKVQLQFNIQDPGFRTPHHGWPASWHLAQPAAWRKPNPPSGISVERINLRLWCSVSQEEAARWSMRPQIIGKVVHAFALLWGLLGEPGLWTLSLIPDIGLNKPR